MRRARWLLAVPAAGLLLSWLLSSWFPVFIFVLFLPLPGLGLFRASREQRRSGTRGPEDGRPDQGHHGDQI